jgi:hypothetical protein
MLSNAIHVHTSISYYALLLICRVFFSCSDSAGSPQAMVKSSQVITLPKAKSKNPQQAEQGHAQMQQCL